MPYIDVDDGKIIAQTEWVDKELIRIVPGMNWDPAAKRWHGPLSWGTCVALRGVFGERLVVGPALNDWATEDYERRVAPCLQLRTTTAYPAEYVWDDKLFDFQLPGCDFLILSYFALLADSMGTGKTIQAVRALRRLVELGYDPFPVCCIVPNSTKKKPWEETFHDWFPAANVFILPSGASAAKRSKILDEARETPMAVVILNWEVARLHSRLAPYGNVRLIRCLEHGGADPDIKIQRCEVHPKELNTMGFRTVVVDEVHKAKDPKAKQTRAVWAVQHGPEVQWRWSLTGTPIANHPGDLWAIMHGLSPHEYPTRTKYVDRYCLMSWSTFGAMDIVGVRPDTKDEFFKILDPRFRRMPKELVLKFLPPKLRSLREAAMPTKQQRAYKQIADGMVTRLEDGSLVLATNNLTQNLRLIQFSSSYATVSETGDVLLAEPSNKLDVLDEILDEMEGRPVVVCAESRQLILLAAARLEKRDIEHRLIIGGMTDDQRAQSLNDFMNGTARVMLFTIKAGGVGLTMTAADTIVFLQRSWSMLENKQAEDRVHRIGSEIHESIHVIDIVAPGTIEEDQILKLYEKTERLEEIVRDKQTLADAAAQGDAAAQARLQALAFEEDSIIASDLTGHNTSDVKEYV